jgi:hypothetical protein
VWERETCCASMFHLQIQVLAAEEARIPARVHAAVLQRFVGGTHAQLGFESVNADVGVTEGSQQVNTVQTGGRKSVPKHSSPAGSPDMEPRTDRHSHLAGSEAMLPVSEQQIAPARYSYMHDTRSQARAGSELMHVKFCNIAHVLTALCRSACILVADHGRRSRAECDLGD